MHKLGFDVDEMNEGRTEGKVYSLIVHNEGSQRSYKIEIAPPAGKSYASDIAEKYGVTYDMLVNKENSWLYALLADDITDDMWAV